MKTASSLQGYSEVIPAWQGNFTPEKTQDRVIPAVSPEAKEQKDQEACAIRLTTQEEAFLEDVLRHPASTMTQRYLRLGFSSRCGNDLKTSLVRSGCVHAHSVSLPNGRVKILSLTDEGRTALGLSSNESDRQGGPEHRYWAGRLAEHLRACGYEVTEEAPIGGGKTVDLVASRQGQRIAFEVETGKSDALANVRKCLASGMDRVIEVAVSPAVKQALMATLPQDTRVRCLTVGEVMNQYTVCPPTEEKQTRVRASESR